MVSYSPHPARLEASPDDVLKTAPLGGHQALWPQAGHLGGSRRCGAPATILRTGA